MLGGTLGHLFRALYHSFYPILCLAGIETQASVSLPGKTPKLAPVKHQRKHSKPQRKRAISSRLPEDTWDGHMHIIDPGRYPLSGDAVYTPSVHSIWDAVSFEDTVSMKNIVAVQPSIYGNDNSAIIDTLKALGPERSRGVVVFDESTIDNATLQEWHSLGVRGIRLNLASTGKSPDIESFKNTIERYAAIAKPLDWMVQIYMSMELLPALESTIKNLGVKLCLDHFAQPTKPLNTTATNFDPYSINGFSTLISLLNHGNTFVKFSAPYRVKLDKYQLDAMAREILRVRKDRAVFATDWPHTRFEGLDIRPFEEQCLEWAEEAGCVGDVFSNNAKMLWDIRN
ncbi:hypothetical protein Q7P37_002529 [Cladosporium fusiforme]